MSGGLPIQSLDGDRDAPGGLSANVKPAGQWRLPCGAERSVSLTPPLTGLRTYTRAHESGPQVHEMLLILHLFGEDVSQIQGTGDVPNFNGAIQNGVADGHLTDVKIPEPFGDCRGLGPVHGALVVGVEEGGGTGRETEGESRSAWRRRNPSVILAPSSIPLILASQVLRLHFFSRTAPQSRHPPR